MKIATWNVNSLKVRLPQVLTWLEHHQPDVLCLQETKLEDHAFPREDFQALGYAVAHHGQKTYNGVALLARSPLNDIALGMDNFPDEQKRLIAATVGDLRVVCAYFPNGQSLDSDKFQYKLRWLDALSEWLREALRQYPKLVLAGDYNIAPEDRDVKNPAAWAGQILCSEPEREAFKKLIDIGLVDSFRLFEQPEKIFTWWDYRMMSFRRNDGLRIDHILISKALERSCIACSVDKTPRQHERPSDHAPVISELRSA
jgi:exodeoxyribonuclease-3